MLVLGRPSGNLDTDMLAVPRRPSDSWPEHFLVVSHDRFLIERALPTTNMPISAATFAVPGGVDEEYLKLVDAAAEQTAKSGELSGARPQVNEPQVDGSSRQMERGAEQRGTSQAQKRFDSIERRMDEAQELPVQIETNELC